MTESDQPIKEEIPRTRQPRLSSEKALPKSGAETIIKIIKGYAVASNGGEQQVNYKDVASVAGLSPTLVSGNNSFLLESQILISPKYGFYLPSESAIRFAREAAWDETSAKAHIRKLIIGSWYGQIALQNFSLRPVLTKDEIKRSLAIKSGATEGESGFLDYLVDFLIYSGIMTETEAGTLNRGNLDETLPPSQPFNLELDKISEKVENQNGETRREETPLPNHQISLVVHVHFNNLDELTEQRAQQLHRWFKNLQSQTDTQIDLSTEKKP